MPLPLGEIIATLNEHLTDRTLVLAISKDLIAAEKAAKEEKTAEPRGKTRLVCFVRKDLGSNVLGSAAYVITVPDTDRPESETYHGAALLGRLRKAAQAHNEAPRGRRKARAKVTTWMDLFRGVKAKTFKASGSAISVKAKGEPVELVILESEEVGAP